MSEAVPYIRALLPNGSLPPDTQAFVSAQIQQEAVPKALSGTTPDLNTLFTPGNYRASSAQMGSGSNAPTQIGAVIEVVGGPGLSTTQRFTPIAPYGLAPAGAYFSRINLWNAPTTWNPWILHSGETSTSPRELWGNGRPDIPATTPYTQAQLNSVPSGHKYISLDGPQGAWVWRKTGSTTWAVTEGDTGWRAITQWTTAGVVTGSPMTGLEPSPGLAGGVYYRRVGNQVNVRVQAARVTATAGQIEIPSGFSSGAPYVMGAIMASQGMKKYLAGASSIYLSAAVGDTFGDGSYASQTSWVSTSLWPSTLPGTAI